MAKAGAIVIDISAGTAQFLVDMDKANVKLQQFGKGAQESGTHVTSSMMASSAAIRMLENPLGNNLRAAERFLAVIPGVGAALRIAFPVIGALALAEALGRVIGKSAELKAAEEALAQATEKADQKFFGMQQTMDRLTVDRITAIFGSAAGKRAEKTTLEQQADQIKIAFDDAYDAVKLVTQTETSGFHGWHPMGWGEAESKTKVDAAAQALRDLRAQYIEIQGKIASAGEDTGRALAKESGDLMAKQIDAAEQASARQSQISKQRYDSEMDMAHAAEVQRIAGVVSEYARTVQLGQEEIRFAKAKEEEINGFALATRDRLIGTRGNNGSIASKAGAESMGKSAPEQNLIREGAQADTQKARDEYSLATGKSALDTQAAQQKSTLELIELNRRLAETLSNKVSAAAKKTQDDVDAETAKHIIALQRVSEIQDKGSGEQAALKIKAQQIALEGNYGSVLSHSLSQQITYMQQIAQLDHEKRQADIDGLKAELADAEALDEQAKDLVKIADLKREIANLTKEDSNANAQATANAGNAQKNGGLAAQLGGAAQNGVNSLSNALATGIMNGGKGLGKDIRQSLKGIGKEMLGDVIKESTGQLVVAITGQTIATNAQTLATWALEAAEYVGALLGFAGGGTPAPGVPYMVGEHGPEVRIDGPGTIIPNHMIGGSSGGRSVGSARAAANTYGGHSFHQTNHIYESADAQETGRHLTNLMKSMIPGAAAYSS